MKDFCKMKKPFVVLKYIRFEVSMETKEQKKVSDNCEEKNQMCKAKKDCLKFEIRQCFTR